MSLSLSDHIRLVDAVSTARGADAAMLMTILMHVAKYDPRAFVKAVEAHTENAKTVEAANVGPRFKVLLMSMGPNKISCIKAMREITGMGLADAKAFCENAPRTIRRNITEDEANDIVRRVRDIGGHAAMTSHDEVPDRDFNAYGGASIPKF